MRLVGPIEPATSRGRLSPEAAGAAIAHRAGGRFAVDLARPVAQSVIRQGDAIGVEGIGGDDVGPGPQEAGVDLLDRLRPGERQEVVTARQWAG